MQKRLVRCQVNYSHGLWYSDTGCPICRTARNRSTHKGKWVEPEQFVPVHPTKEQRRLTKDQKKWLAVWSLLPAFYAFIGVLQDDLFGHILWGAFAGAAVGLLFLKAHTYRTRNSTKLIRENLEVYYQRQIMRAAGVESPAEIAQKKRAAKVVELEKSLEIKDESGELVHPTKESMQKQADEVLRVIAELQKQKGEKK